MDNSNQLKSIEDTILRAQNELAQAQAKLEELKKENKSGWKSYKKGFCIQSNGSINVIANNIANPHNCFRTENLAKLRQKQREAEDELFNIWESLVVDWRPDWSNIKQPKYTLRIEFDGSLSTDHFFTIVDASPYRYFPTEELALKQYKLASEHAKAYFRGEF